jgi:molybdopterin-containing oxidoreductase family iron-sulfur binding subunit
MDKAKRRSLKVLGATLGASAFAYAMAPLREFTRDLTLDQFLQKHYKELSKADLAALITRLEGETKKA